MAKVQIIAFPASNGCKAKNCKAGRQVKNIDGIKYFTEKQIKLIRRTVRNKAEMDQQKGKVTGPREWMAIDLLTCSGARVAEAANVRCGDLKIRYGECEVFIRHGKGSVSRHIQIPKNLKDHLKRYLKWKQENDESTGCDDHLFVGQRGPWTSQAIQQIVKKYLRALNMYESGKSVHALRHSYAVNLYRQQRDLKALQKQLGHASIQTTQIYADVTKEDIQDQLKGFWS